MGNSDRDVLLVESSPDEMSSFIDSLEEINASIHMVTNGDEALDFIHQRGDHADSPRPDLILLDLNLPGTSGNEILKEMKDTPELHRIPVLVLTATIEAEKTARSYDLHANAHIKKPADKAEADTITEALEKFWLKVAHLPP
ncbi:response regulator [Haloterrigena salinisoli]|uniref:response regulator n=1 Tax=Haloterrigena salinisoli TaxID=3132747 RepID=UPI0030D4C171